LTNYWACAEISEIVLIFSISKSLSRSGYWTQPREAHLESIELIILNVLRKHSYVMYSDGILSTRREKIGCHISQDINVSIIGQWKCPCVMFRVICQDMVQIHKTQNMHWKWPVLSRISKTWHVKDLPSYGPVSPSACVAPCPPPVYFSALKLLREQEQYDSALLDFAQSMDQTDSC
jgi:hypothetical protein